MKLTRASDEYKISIADFEGPLDLLLHLIREQKLDIKTVKLALVTKQYLEFLQQLDKLDMDLASEFIEVGATLIEIKSRSILPRISEGDESAEDLEGRLLARLEQYKLLKEASQKLKNLENVNRFYKEPEPLKTEVRYLLDNLNIDGLVSAFSKLLYKIERSATPILETQIKLDRFTVADKMKDIVTLLEYCDAVMFFDLFGEDFTRGEVINTFLAILELLKNQIIFARQNGSFEDIAIEKGENYERKGEEQFSTASYEFTTANAN